MHKAWRIDRRTITATATTADDAASPESPSPLGLKIAAEEQKRRLLSLLTQNMSAAIVTAILRETDTGGGIYDPLNG